MTTTTQEIETMATTSYVATYALPETATETDRNTVEAIEAPQNLDEVIETCRASGASATLRDDAGFTKGWVHADGTYQLT